MKFVCFLILLFPSLLFAQQIATSDLKNNTLEYSDFRSEPIYWDSNQRYLKEEEHDLGLEKVSSLTLSPNFDINLARQQWEIGLHSGLVGVFGDVGFQPTWSAGAHIRRAIDYIFSIRVEGKIGQAKGEDSKNGAFLTDMQTASLHFLVSLNSMSWNVEKQKKLNPYFFAGGGLTRYRVDALPRNTSVIVEQDWTKITHAEFGIGMAYRINEKINIGLENNLIIPIGSNSDLIDGVNRKVRDVLSYTNVRLNFNIGRGNDISEPLYWVNPLKSLLLEISELKNRPQFDPTDNDKDGVLDMVDEEQNTPFGVPVDVRGRTLDSDKDGLPDYLDKEPYSIPGYTVDDFGVNNDSTLNSTTKEDVKKMLDNILQTQTETTEKNFDTNNELINWILPLIHFDNDSYQIRFSEYGNLLNVAKIIQGKPTLKFVITGYTDKTASDLYNDILSYNRAKAVIEFLVGAHDISRERLILHYSGENTELVPSTGDSFMNRRVEFHVAKPNEKEMTHPK